MMASGVSPATMSLVYEGKSLPKTANCGLFKPLATVVIECAALPGGALNDSDNDDDFVKAQSMDSVPLVNNRRSFMSSSIVNDAEPEPLEEMTTEDLIKCHFVSLKERIDEEQKGWNGDNDKTIENVHREIHEWYDSIRELDKDRQVLTATVLADGLQEGSIEDYKDKGNYWLDYINANPQLRLLFRLRSREFNMQQIMLVMKGNIMEAMTAV